MPVLNIQIPHRRVDKGSNVTANKYFVDLLKNIFITNGTNMIDPFTFTPQLCLMIMMSHILVLSFVFMLFTNKPLTAKLEAFCLASGLYQGIHKLYTVVIYNKEFFNLFAQQRMLHTKYCDDRNVAPVLKKVSLYCIYVFEGLSIAIFGVSLAYTLLPIYLWKQHGLLTTIFPMHIPFIDWHKPIGYIINTVNHLYCITFGIIGIMSGDCIFMYLVIQSIGYKGIFKCRVDRLNRLLECEPRDFKKIETQLYECIQAHQDYLTYIESVDRIFAQWCLAQLITSEIFLTVSLLMTLWKKWIVGPFIAIGGLCQLLEYCILGTVITVQNEKVSDIIYDMRWYLMPVRLQKLVVIMILRAQKPAELNAGKFAKLNVATAMQLLKTTYSFIMMILEFLR